MFKRSKKVISVILAVIVAASFSCFAFAQDNTTKTGTLKVMSYNVDGLPIPSFLSSTGRKPLEATKQIAKQVNVSECGILSTQEDFNYHSTLKRNLNMDYRTLTSGGAGIGDGLNIFSKYPIYNVGRVAWDSAYGVFDSGSDELTPKGILYCTVELADGVYIDVYDIHADANEDTESLQAKADQYDQLIKLVEEHSGTDRAVLLTGDFNANFALFREGYQNGVYGVDLYSKLMVDFIDHGFKDAWIEDNLDGNYGYSYSDLRRQYGCEYQRTWDTLDHIFFRSGSGLELELADSYYDGYDDAEISWEGYISDHAALVAEFTYTVDSSKTEAPNQTKTERFNIFTNIWNVLKRVASALIKIIVNLPGLIAGGEIGWQK